MLLSGCEWINQPVDSMIVAVENNNENALTSTVVTVRISGDVDDETIDLGAIDASQTSEVVVPIEEKHFEIFEVFISYSTTVPDDSGGYGYTIDPDNPTKLDDPIGAENYHTFRALAKSDFRIHVEVSSYDSGSFETISNQLWMGYVYPEE